MTEKFVQRFRTLCQEADGDASMPVTVTTVRQLLLYKTEGMCPARFLVTRGGNLMALREVCTSSVVEWIETQETSGMDKSWDLSSFVAQAMTGETKAVSEGSLPCVLGASLLRQVVKTKDTNNSVLYRASLLRLFDEKKMALRAIHIFRWDGTPRSASETEWAVCHYPIPSGKKRDYGQMIRRLLYMAGAATIGGLAYDNYAMRRSRDPAVFTDTKMVTRFVEENARYIINRFFPGENWKKRSKALGLILHPDKCHGNDKIREILTYYQKEVDGVSMTELCNIFFAVLFDYMKRWRWS